MCVVRKRTASVKCFVLCDVYDYFAILHVKLFCCCCGCCWFCECVIINALRIEWNSLAVLCLLLISFCVVSCFALSSNRTFHCCHTRSEALLSFIFSATVFCEQREKIWFEHIKCRCTWCFVARFIMLSLVVISPVISFFSLVLLFTLSLYTLVFLHLLHVIILHIKHTHSHKIIIWKFRQRHEIKRF